MTNEQYLHREIQKIKERNKRVETDKAWETSWMRRCAVAFLTYLVVCVFFITIGVSNPFLSAIVPVLGFMLSTFSLEFLKEWWMKNH
jgi:peptidoglycan/LPS O-acetylase OafA/YrhL